MYMAILQIDISHIFRNMDLYQHIFNQLILFYDFMIQSFQYISRSRVVFDNNHATHLLSGHLLSGYMPYQEEPNAIQFTVEFKYVIWVLACPSIYKW